jgi:hypothetical protein
MNRQELEAIRDRGTIDLATVHRRLDASSLVVIEPPECGAIAPAA